jgi:transposase-like protein
MPEKRRRFSPQFKAEAVQLVIESGRPVAEVARDLGINDAWRRDNPEPERALTPMERRW